MRTRARGIVIRLLRPGLLLGAGVWVIAEAALRQNAWSPTLAIHALLLLVPAAGAAWLAAESHRLRGATRLALGFILAALILLPPPGALLVTVAAAAAGCGGGIAGARRRSVGQMAAVLVAVVVAQFHVSSLGWRGAGMDLAALARIGLSYLVIQGFSIGLGLALDPPSSRAPHRLEPRRLLLESLSVPLAWVLASLLEHGDAWPAAALALLALLGLATLLKLERLVGRLESTHAALAARLTELGTLHSIGREILSSMDPARVFATLDRECRKVFEVDSFLIALCDDDRPRPRAAYLRRSGHAAQTSSQPLPPGLVSWVAERKRARRIDDLDDPRWAGSLAVDRLEARSRSAMAAPLIVEERVIGVLTVQAHRAGAHDGHQLSVLTTIAQQAAVAIENARHYQLATIDSLTGFLLRDYFFRRVDQEHERVRRYGGRLALLMIDIDGFKRINDENGHLVGDRFLREVSATIRAQLRGADLACRYGGDEFCLLLPETDLEGGWIIGERIRSAVAHRVLAVESAPLRTTVSIGVAATPPAATAGLSGLVRNADEALYRAKRSGRDRVVRYAA